MKKPPNGFTLVILESPYKGKTPEETRDNVEYARACVRDCLHRGESPIASHLLFTQEGILNDNSPEERELGIEAGLAWSLMAHRAVVYIDKGITLGMRRGIQHHNDNGLVISYRRLNDFLTYQLTNVCADVRGNLDITS